jgi:hypothetical protein
VPVEREVLLAVLAAAGIDYEVFADTAAVLVEAEPRPRSGWRTWLRRAAAEIRGLVGRLLGHRRWSRP